MGHHHEAEQVCNIAREQAPADTMEAFLKNRVGCIKNDLGEYSEAMTYHQRVLDIQKKTLPPNHPDLASSYNNIGAVYSDMGDYPKACLSFENAVRIGQQVLPADHPHLQLYRKVLAIIRK